ncbi:MAG: MFS transporter [Acidimicrobiia bacterium]
MTASPPATALPIRRLLIAIVMVMVSTLPVFLTGASFIQLQADLGLKATSLGIVTAAFFLAASITSTPLGRLVERIGWRTAMRINCVVSAVVVILIAITVHSPWSLGALLLASGVVYGFTNPAANHALAHGSPPGRRGVVFGLKHAGIPASTLAAGASVPLLVLTVGWRPTFAVAALPALVAWLLIGSDRETEPGTTPAEATRPGRSNALLSPGQLITLAIGSSCATWTAVFLGSFLVAAAVDASFTQSQAGTLLFAGSVVSIVARVTYGAVADRRSAAGFVGVGLIMGLGAIVVLTVADAHGLGFIVGVLAAFALGWGWPGLLTYAVVNANTATAASSSAVTQAGVFLGAGLGPIAIGAVVEHWSFRAAWLIDAALLAVAAAVVISVAMTRRRRELVVHP